MILPDNLDTGILRVIMEHPEAEDLGGHPLFPRMADAVGPDLRKYDLIQVVRILPDNKTREACPRLFTGSELRSWEQIVELYGGECHYQLQAMCGKTRRYTARSLKYFFGSPARRTFVEASGTKQGEAPPVQVPAGYVPYYAVPPPVAAPATPPAAAPVAGQGAQAAGPTMTEMMADILRMVSESNARMQAEADARAAAVRQQQVHPQIEMIRTVAAIIKAQNEAARREAELEGAVGDEDDEGDEVGESVRGNGLGQIAAVVAAVKEAIGGSQESAPAQGPAVQGPPAVQDRPASESRLSEVAPVVADAQRPAGLTAEALEVAMALHVIRKLAGDGYVKRFGLTLGVAGKTGNVLVTPASAGAARVFMQACLAVAPRESGGGIRFLGAEWWQILRWGFEMGDALKALAGEFLRAAAGAAPAVASSGVEAGPRAVGKRRGRRMPMVAMAWRGARARGAFAPRRERAAESGTAKPVVSQSEGVLASDHAAAEASRVPDDAVAMPDRGQGGRSPSRERSPPSG